MVFLSKDLHFFFWPFFCSYGLIISYDTILNLNSAENAREILTYMYIWLTLTPLRQTQEAQEYIL